LSFNVPQYESTICIFFKKAYGLRAATAIFCIVGKDRTEWRKLDKRRLILFSPSAFQVETIYHFKNGVNQKKWNFIWKLNKIET
jgi:hypothetical protein